jgi:uncharacterized protein
VAIPVRRCLACRRREARDRLVRLVVADGAIAVDPLTRRPGRGAYVCTQQDCLEAALRRDGAALIRALRVDRRQVTVNEQAIREHWRTAAASTRRHDAVETPRPPAQVVARGVTE